jgi:hypothetical protein
MNFPTFSISFKSLLDIQGKGKQKKKGEEWSSNISEAKYEKQILYDLV